MDRRIKWKYRALSLALALAAIGCLVLALRSFSGTDTFRNPIAYTWNRQGLFVFDKDAGVIQHLAYRGDNQPLELLRQYAVESDDSQYYYMIRKLYSGPEGVVVHSYIYEQGTSEFVGYRFREYHSFGQAPRDLFTIFLENPSAYPELSYACDAKGRHWFLNNCSGQQNLWRIPAQGGVVMRDGVPDPAMRALGSLNDEYAKWADLGIDESGTIFVTSATDERVVWYNAEGTFRGIFGKVGFESGELLAPDEVSVLEGDPPSDTRLVIASTGNRSWVEFNTRRQLVRTLEPLAEGYPFSDILVGQVYKLQDDSYVSFDLVNGAFIRLDKSYSVIDSFRVYRPARTWSLVFLAGILLAGAYGSRRPRPIATRLRFPFFLKLLLLFVPLLVFSALLEGDWVKDELTADLEDEYVRRSANLAMAIRNSVPMEQLERIQDPADRNSDTYEEIYQTVSRIVDTEHVENTPKWIIHKIRDGRFYFGISIWRGSIYEPFIVPQDRTMFFQVLKEKTCQYGRFTDEQGAWFSYLCPIMDASNTVQYVIELYRPTEELDRADQAVNQRVTRIITWTLLAAVILLLIFSYVTARPLHRLMEAVREVSAGNFTHIVRVHTRDEVGDLSRMFNRMMVALRKYTRDLAATTAEKERIQSDLRLARSIQQDMLPRTFPPNKEWPFVEIYARMEPAREVGGDYYDFFRVDDDHIGVLIADVSGKGVPAGLFMMRTRAHVHSLAQGNLSAADAIHRVNRLIAPDNPSVMFVTMSYFIFDCRTGRVVFCNAGHNPPILLHNGKAQYVTVEEGHGHGMAVGVMEDAPYSDAEIQLEPGDSLVLYTDGITEPVDAEGVMFGEDRLLAEVEQQAHLANRDNCDRLFDVVFSHQQGQEQFDDMTILFFKYSGTSDSNNPGGA